MDNQCYTLRTKLVQTQFRVLLGLVAGSMFNASCREPEAIHDLCGVMYTLDSISSGGGRKSWVVEFECDGSTHEYVEMDSGLFEIPPSDVYYRKTYLLQGDELSAFGNDWDVVRWDSTRLTLVGGVGDTFFFGALPQAQR